MNLQTHFKVRHNASLERRQRLNEVVIAHVAKILKSVLRLNTVYC